LYLKKSPTLRPSPAYHEPSTSTPPLAPAPVLASDVAKTAGVTLPLIRISEKIMIVNWFCKQYRTFTKIS